jgi:hypothetical protein
MKKISVTTGGNHTHVSLYFNTDVKISALNACIPPPRPIGDSLTAQEAEGDSARCTC